MLHSVLWLKSVLEVGFYFSTWVLKSDLRAWFIKEPNSYLFRIQRTFKCRNKCLYNPPVFPDNRWRWRQSAFHQVLAEIPFISYCEVFTSKRGLLFFTQYILRGIPFVSFYIKSIFIRFCLYCLCIDTPLQPLSYYFACLQLINNELLCIIAGALPMFSARGCVPNIRSRECTRKYCP